MAWDSTITVAINDFFINIHSRQGSKHKIDGCWMRWAIWVQEEVVKREYYEDKRGKENVICENSTGNL